MGPSLRETQANLQDAAVVLQKIDAKMKDIMVEFKKLLGHITDGNQNVMIAMNNAGEEPGPVLQFLQRLQGLSVAELKKMLKPFGNVTGSQDILRMMAAQYQAGIVVPEAAVENADNEDDVEAVRAFLQNMTKQLAGKGKGTQVKGVSMDGMHAIFQYFTTIAQPADLANLQPDDPYLGVYGDVGGEVDAVGQGSTPGCPRLFKMVSDEGDKIRAYRQEITGVKCNRSEAHLYLKYLGAALLDIEYGFQSTTMLPLQGEHLEETKNMN